MFNTLLYDAHRAAKETSQTFAVLFLDLDRFKLINDSLGHSAGDQLLKEATRRIRECIRTEHVVARQGGDEFIILLDALTTKEQAGAIAERLLETLSAPVFLNGHECRISCSIGIAVYPNDASDPEEIVKKADIAMYAAKADGNNAYRFFFPELQSRSLANLVLEADLRHAIENDQLFLHYQPKVKEDGSIVGVEALLRWKHPQHGMIPPNTFIPVAEESGLIIPIGRWVIETACRQSLLWQSQGHPAISMAVNLSSKQFMDDGLLELMDDVLAATGLPSHLLQLELTESTVMQNVAHAMSTMRAISDRGIQLAIDDFGKGYSSMSLMKHFPIDTIKIDRCLVQNLGGSAQDRAISAAIITLGQALDMTVVAEGVETFEQEGVLKSYSCDEFQGFLFSRPVSADQIGCLLANAGNLIDHEACPPLVPRSGEERGPVNNVKNFSFRRTVESL